MNHDSSLPDLKPASFWQTRYALGFLVIGAIATYFILSEHRAHFLGALPLLLLFSCPLMHVFMHHGHGGHGGDLGHQRHHGGDPASTSQATSSTPKIEDPS